MENTKCLYSLTYGNEKDKKGTFIKFGEQILEDDSGKKFQNTMGILKDTNGNIIMVEPSCIKIVEEK